MQTHGPLFTRENRDRGCTRFQSGSALAVSERNFRILDLPAGRSPAELPTSSENCATPVAPSGWLFDSRPPDTLTGMRHDLDDACEFYSDVMGFTLKFRDGNRWATFDTGAVTLALAAREELAEQNLPETSALNIKVADVDLATQRSLWGGAKLVAEMKATAHEIRSTVQDPSGRLINFYAPNKQ